jgi:hypothetical protein
MSSTIVTKGILSDLESGVWREGEKKRKEGRQEDLGKR